MMFGSNFITILLHVNTVVLIPTTSRIIGINGPIFKLAKYFWVCLRLKMQLTVATSHPMCLIMKCYVLLKVLQNMEVLWFGLGFMTKTIVQLLTLMFELHKLPMTYSNFIHIEM